MGKANRKKFSEQLREQATMTFWHGGSPGLQPGSLVIPGNRLPTHKWIASYQPVGWAAVTRPDFAYVTTDQDLALDYAIRYHKALQKPGAIYEVTPVGLCAHDPDYPEGVSFRCKGATVVAVARTGITAATPSKRAALRYQTYDDGYPYYDADGYPVPNRRHGKLDITAADLRPAGQWASFEMIMNLSGQLVKRRYPHLTQEDIDRL